MEIAILHRVVLHAGEVAESGTLLRTVKPLVRATCRGGLVHTLTEDIPAVGDVVIELQDEGVVLHILEILDDPLAIEPLIGVHPVEVAVHGTEVEVVTEGDVHHIVLLGLAHVGV